MYSSLDTLAIVLSAPNFFARIAVLIFTDSLEVTATTRCASSIFADLSRLIEVDEPVIVSTSEFEPMLSNLFPSISMIVISCSSKESCLAK